MCDPEHGNQFRCITRRHDKNSDIETHAVNILLN